MLNADDPLVTRMRDRTPARIAAFSHDGPDAGAERAAASEFLDLVTSDRGRRALEIAGLAPLPQ